MPRYIINLRFHVQTTSLPFTAFRDVLLRLTAGGDRAGSLGIRQDPGVTTSQAPIATGKLSAFILVSLIRLSNILV